MSRRSGLSIDRKYKTLSVKQRDWFTRRQAVQPVIGHLKQDHGLRFWWLNGAACDALCTWFHVQRVSSLRSFLRSIMRVGIKLSWQSFLHSVPRAIHTLLRLIALTQRPTLRLQSHTVSITHACYPVLAHLPGAWCSPENEQLNFADSI
jgi:hypothetical protein